MPTEFDQSIANSTRPNAGRIYDYLLGGNHYFPIDEQMGKELLKMVPFASDYAKLTRWFLRNGIHRAVNEKFTKFLDFATGVPANDHIHKNSPDGTKVIYSDIDPVTVNYGRKIIGENPIVKYVYCDAAKPEVLLDSDLTKSLFGKDHKVAIGYNGICWFLKNEQINYAMKVLYEWASKGSIIFLTDIDGENLSESVNSILELYKNINQPMYIRSKDVLKELCKPWKLEEPGFMYPEEWIHIENTISKESIEKFGGNTIGGFLRK